MFEASITIQKDGADLNLQLIIPELVTWMEGKCDKAYFAAEKGNRESLLHLQGVVRISSQTANSARALSRLMKGDLGFTDSSSPLYKEGKVSSKACQYKRLHNFIGLLGYCQKGRNQPWFQQVHHNVSPQELNSGVHLYMREGVPDTQKNAILITQANMLSKALQFHNMYPSPDRGHLSLQEVLCAMFRTGMVVPEAKWAITFPLQRNRAEALWNLCVRPKDTSIADINLGFFEQHAASQLPRYYEILQQRLNNDDPRPDLDYMCSRVCAEM